ncbi:MAG: type II toxin-antitoxin system Phd/YefM family antitoxin [Coriobacteriales bacterium]|nr:type II toxin-antitoxin system Phd/YefM family antitoxin [Coriobacteriales bacterium]
MTQVNVLEAKNGLSALLGLIESGREQSIIIARRGKPVARLVPYTPDTSARVGIAASEMLVAEDWDMHEGDEEIAGLFGVA